MKRKIKTSLSMLLVATLLVTPTSVNVYASTTSKIVDTEIAEGETYFIKDDSSLWRNNENGTFTKIAENVLTVYPESKWGDCAYITKDNKLMIYEFNTKKGKGVNTEVTTSVKDVVFTDYEMYLLTTTGELYEYTFQYKNYFDGSYKFNSFILTEGVDKFTADNYSLWVIKSDKTLWYNENSYMEDGIKILDNVKDVVAGADEVYILSNDGKLYNYSNYYYDDVNITVENVIETNVKDIQLNVRAIDDFEEVITVFLIKNDNTLWGLGENTHGQLGAEFGVATTEDFVKIADNVVDVDISKKHTTYVTKDGKLWGMGSNKNGELGTAEGDKIDKFNDEGYCVIATDVESADLFYDVTTYRLEDGSLWGLGSNNYNIISDNDKANIIEPQLIAEDVKWWNTENTGDSLPYVVGEDRELYFNGMNYSLEIGENYITSDVYRKMYEFTLDYLYIDLTFEYFLENKKEVFNLIYDKEYELTEEESRLYYEKQNEFVKNFLDETNSIPISTGVVQSSEEYFVDTKNDLYIIDENNKPTKIRSNVVQVFTENYDIYIVDTSGKLYCAKGYEYVDLSFNYDFDWEDYRNDLEPGDRVVRTEYTRKGSEVVVMRKVKDLNFVDTGISGVTNIEGISEDIYVLKNNGSLLKIETIYDYVYIDNDGEYSGKVNIEYETYNYRDVVANFKNVEIEDDAMYFGYEGELSSYWSGYLEIYNKNELVFVEDNTFKITEIANGVQNFNIAYDQIVYVDKNDVLWGRGDNSFNQLISNGDYYYEEFVKIAEGVKTADIDGDTLILLKKDGTLLGRGLNTEGELGFGVIGYYYDIKNVHTPTQIQ